MITIVEKLERIYYNKLQIIDIMLYWVIIIISYL